MDAAFGGASLKNDFGGNSIAHFNNLDLFFSRGFDICPQLPGYVSAYYNNTLYMLADGPYGNNQIVRRRGRKGGGPSFITASQLCPLMVLFHHLQCTGGAATIVHDNKISTPTGVVTECGEPLAQWQRTPVSWLQVIA